MMLTEDIDDMLRQYYSWAAHQDPSDLYYPHQDAVRRLRGSSVRSLSISDDDAMEINRALGMLKSDDAEAFRLIERYYGERRSLRWMEKRREGSRKALSRKLSEGRQYIRGVLAHAIA